MAVKITCGDFYEGLGKTTTLAVFALLLQSQNKKTLVIDFDPTAKLTKILEKKYNRRLQDFHLSVFESLQIGDLSVGITALTFELDIIPSNNDFLTMPPILFAKKPEHFLADLLESIEAKYDFILMDLPSIQNIYTNHVYVAADYILPIVEPARISGQAFSNIIEEIETTVKRKNKKLKILGIIESAFKLETSYENFLTMRICDKRVQKLMFSEMLHNGSLIYFWLNSKRSCEELKNIKYLATFNILLEDIQKRLK